MWIDFDDLKVLYGQVPEHIDAARALWDVVPPVQVVVSLPLAEVPAFTNGDPDCRAGCALVTDPRMYASSLAKYTPFRREADLFLDGAGTMLGLDWANSELLQSTARQYTLHDDYLLWSHVTDLRSQVLEHMLPKADREVTKYVMQSAIDSGDGSKLEVLKRMEGISQCLAKEVLRALATDIGRYLGSVPAVSQGPQGPNSGEVRQSLVVYRARIFPERPVTKEGDELVRLAIHAEWLVRYRASVEAANEILLRVPVVRSSRFACDTQHHIQSEMVMTLELKPRTVKLIDALRHHIQVETYLRLMHTEGGRYVSG